MKNLLQLTVMILTLASFSTTSNAEENGFGFGKRGGHEQRAAKMKEYLELTDEQAEAIKAIREESQQKGGRPGREMMQALKELDPEDPDYMQQVEKLAEEQSDEIKSAIMAKAEARAKIHEVLTPEQREKMDQMHDKMQQRRQEGKGERRWRRGGEEE